ncbi:MAG TPA: tRNA-binding protein [Candidatus Bathyarchaeia archaeon]|nr:tRNA-binding protein [Candidatus Bathyarchaeia archaeon]
MSVTIKDFEKLSLRVGKITAAERIPGMTKILKVQVDTGERVAQAIAGGAQFYQPESFVGKRVIIITNMETKTIKGVTSEVMLLAADLAGKPVWLTVEEDVPPGTKVR